MPTGSAAPKKRATYWSALNFLDTVTEERVTITNVKKPDTFRMDEDDEINIEEPETEECNTDTIDQPSAINGTKTATINRKRCMETAGCSSTVNSNRQKQKKTANRQEVIEAMKARESSRDTLNKYLELALKPDKEDEIDCFLKGIGCTIKKFNDIMKAEVKTHIFKIVTDYEMIHITTNNSVQTPTLQYQSSGSTSQSHTSAQSPASYDGDMCHYSGDNSYVQLQPVRNVNDNNYDLSDLVADLDSVRK